jgi:hypothetical protein
MFNLGGSATVRAGGRGRRAAFALVTVAVLAIAINGCGSSPSESRQRNATLTAATTATPVTKCSVAGQVKTIKKKKVVCATTTQGKVWYPVAKEKKWVCAKLGVGRSQEGVFSVCGQNAKKKKRWFFTSVLSPVPKGLKSTEPGAIEYVEKLNPTGDSIPLPPRPGAQSSGSPESTSTTIQNDATTVAPNPDGVTSTTVAIDSVTTVPSSTTSTPETTLPPVVDTTCKAKVGDIGPGGGLVFIASSTDGNTTGLCFEAGPATWFSEWGCAGQLIPDDEATSDNKVIGAGRRNTEYVVEQCGLLEPRSGMYAAKFAANLVAGAKDDWFLPSQNEAMALFAQRKLFSCSGDNCAPDLTNSIYWTSSQIDANNAVAINFVGDGAPANIEKNIGRFVRPVRSFS